MKKKKLLLSLLLSVLLLPAFAAKVDTLQIKSASMNTTIQTVVIIPDAALNKNAINCPVVYLLHGHGGNAKTWIGIKPNLPQIADEKNIIFVCPDGKNSWYWNSPQNPRFQFETFLSSELINYIDKHYNTIANRNSRAISGLSMGGHGALWTAIRHKDLFGAVGSMSGGVDIRPFPKNWDMAKQLGEYDTHKQVWDEHTVINQVGKLKNKDLAIIIDCGEDDFFLNVNKELHKKLLENKIDHDFITRPGAHTSTYWNNSIDYHILFFDKLFKKY